MGTKLNNIAAAPPVEQRWNSLAICTTTSEEQAGSALGVTSGLIRSECKVRATPQASAWVRLRFFQSGNSVLREFTLAEHTLEDLASAPLRQGRTFRDPDGLVTKVVVEVEARCIEPHLFQLQITAFSASKPGNPALHSPAISVRVAQA